MTLGRMENFSRSALRRYMKQAKMTQAKLAVYVGTSRAVVSYWVSGQHLPAVPHAPKIARALGCTVMDLADKPDPYATDIVDLRYIRGVPASTVSKATSLSPDKLGLLEEAVSMPKIEYLQILADYYGLTLEELKRAWIARRVGQYGIESLAYLDEKTAQQMAPWPDFFRRRAQDSVVVEPPNPSA
jgi:transcriptional regulator with XRE-family HTH domain